MAYTRKQISRLSKSFEAQPVLEELVQKIVDKRPVSLAEEDFACAKMRILRTGEPPGRSLYDINAIAECENFRFRKTYLQYAFNLDGLGEVRDYHGVVRASIIAEDVNYLKGAAAEWERQMSVKNKNDKPIWNYMIEETQHQHHILSNYLKNNQVTKEEIEYQKRSIFLHSRYVYMQALEFFQDQQYMQKLQPLYDQQILIDPYCFIHTLFRHFASGVKGYQIGQSYNLDTTIPYRELPHFLARLLRIYGNNVPKSRFDSWGIDFIYRKKTYSLYLRPFPHQGKKPLRLQTFFPLKERRHLERVRNRQKIKINSKLTFLVKP